MDENLPLGRDDAQSKWNTGIAREDGQLGLGSNEPDALRASAAEFMLEGLYAHRRITRSEEREFTAGERKRDSQPQEDGGRRSRRQYQ